MFNPFLYFINVIVSSIVFLLLLSLYLLGDLGLLIDPIVFIAMLMLVLPFIVLGGLIGEFIMALIQPHIKRWSYVVGFGVFSLLGVVTNIYAIIFIVRHGWESGAIEYILLGLGAALVYYHTMLVLQYTWDFGKKYA